MVAVGVCVMFFNVDYHFLIIFYFSYYSGHVLNCFTLSRGMESIPHSIEFKDMLETERIYLCTTTNSIPKNLLIFGINLKPRNVFIGKYTFP